MVPKWRSNCNKSDSACRGRGNNWDIDQRRSTLEREKLTVFSHEILLDSAAEVAEAEPNDATPNQTVIQQPTKRPNLPGYISPTIEIIYYPERANLFDGFAVSGRAWGSELQGAYVYVTVAGVTRRAKITDGLWTVIFEDNALPAHYSGQKKILAQFRDSLGHIARTAVSIYVEDFEDSFITVDDAYQIAGHGKHKVLNIAGELNLGTHTEDRELIVLLVRDDAEGRVAAAGQLKNGWQYGEWRARIPLAGVKPGAYKVLAQLMDGANTALTRVMTSAESIML